MSNFDLLNRQCDDIVLISENYCLDKSFDILIKNFQFFEKALNSIDDQNDRVNVIKDRFNKNKDKYYKLLTFVNQFSASLENVNTVFNKYRDTWQTKNTPLEIIYERLIPLDSWGTFNQLNGKFTRYSSNRDSVKEIATQIERWANRNFPEEHYALYKDIKVRLYITGNINDTFTFTGKYKEKCDAGGGSSKVCCNGCGAFGGSKGCNRMGPDGRTCGNMYRYCPATVLSQNCQTGTCRGWGEGFAPKDWKFKELKVSRSIVYADTYLLGSDILNLRNVDYEWTVTDL